MPQQWLTVRGVAPSLVVGSGIRDTCDGSVGGRSRSQVAVCVSSNVSYGRVVVMSWDWESLAGCLSWGTYVFVGERRRLEAIILAGVIQVPAPWCYGGAWGRGNCIPPRVSRQA